jgi:hypothetical protein
MKMRIVTILLFGLIFMIWGCGGDDDDGSDGNGKSTCDFSACGGDVVGTWEVADICIENPERIFSLTGLPSQCSDIIGDLDSRPEGEFIFEEDGTGEANVTLVVDVEMTLTEKCVSALAGGQVTLSPSVCSAMESAFSGESEFEGGSCEAATNACICIITSNEIAVEDGGDYQVEGDRISSGSGAGEPFCVTGNKLQIQSQALGVVAVITLEKK